MTAGQQSRTRVDRALVAVVEEVFATVEIVRQHTIDLYLAARVRGDRLEDRDISQLGKAIRATLRQGTDLAIGLGLIVAPGLLRDQPLRLEWWQRDMLGVELSALRVDLNRQSPGFYDYEKAEWYDVPYRTHRRHVVGPYVDVNGTGRYLLTFTGPVDSAGIFLGVAGVDVPVAWLEARLLSDLGTERPVVVLNADGRVVFSTSPAWLTGELVSVQGGPSIVSRELPGFPWLLGEVPSEPLTP